MNKYELVPSELKALNQWVVWRKEVVGGRETKIPYSVNGDCSKASSTDQKTWHVFTAAEMVAELKGYDGIGFVFSASDPYCGIDIDDCIGADGEIAPWAAEILASMNSYAEISPSGTGIKIWIKCRGI